RRGSPFPFLAGLLVLGTRRAVGTVFIRHARTRRVVPLAVDTRTLFTATLGPNGPPALIIVWLRTGIAVLLAVFLLAGALVLLRFGLARFLRRRSRHAVSIIAAGILRRGTFALSA